MCTFFVFFGIIYSNINWGGKLKSSKLVDLLKEGNFVVPIYLFKMRNKFDLAFEDFIFLVYLSNLGASFPFNPKSIANDLGYSISDVMMKISILTEKRLVNVAVIKNEKGIMEEYMQLEYFYSKVSNVLLEDINFKADNVVPTVNVYETIEEEFGRPLSPMELELVRAWISSGTLEEVIIEAVREASMKAVYNMSYIDKILYEWKKQGLKTKDAILKYKNKFREEKKNTKKVDVFEYNWLDENDE